MRRFWMLVAIAALVLSVAVHVTALFGATFDGQVLFWAVLVSIIVICTPCFVLIGQTGGPKSTTPQAKLRSRIINGVMLGMGLYFAAISFYSLTPEQRDRFLSEGEVSLWEGEREITVGQARVMTLFPVPFFAISALMLWDRMKRQRESLDL